MTFKGYSYDKSKDRFVCRFMINGKRTQIGSFELETDAQECVNKYLRDNNIMVRTAATTQHKTLKACIAFYNSLLNPDSTKSNWRRSFIGLIANTLNEGEDDILTNDELGEKFSGIDVIPIITDFEKVVGTVDGIKSKRDGNLIAVDTKKQYYSAVVALTSNKRNNVVMDKELLDKYKDKVQELDKASNDKRDLNQAQRGELTNEDMTWERFREGLNEYIDTHPFTKTQTGNARLRRACIVAMYVYARPRRVTDYELLEYHSKLPSEEERKGKNILHLEKGKATIYIDVFKIRKRVKNQKVKEPLKTYIKELDPKLTELLQKYIKNAEIKDNSKRTKQEKKDNVTYWFYHIEKEAQTQRYQNSGFSKAISAALKEVYKKTELSVNTLRHAFNTWLLKHIHEFNDAQRKQISEDVGDTPRNPATNERYRRSKKENVGKSVTEIEGNIHVADAIRNGGGEEGSVGGGAEQPDLDEVNSPPNAPNAPNNPKLNATYPEGYTLRQLYQMYGEAVFNVKSIENHITHMLNNGATLSD